MVLDLPEDVPPFPRRELIDRRALSLRGPDGVFFSGAGDGACECPPFSFPKKLFEPFLFVALSEVAWGSSSSRLG